MNKIIYARRKRSERKVYVSLDLKKAFDSISRTMLFFMLRIKCSTREEYHIVGLIANLFKESFLVYDDSKIKVTKGV